MKGLWTYISNLGITSDIQADEVRVIVLLNRICCITCIFLLGYIPLLFLLDEEVMYPFVILEIILFGATYFFIIKQRFQTAKIYFMINAILFLGYIGLIPGRESAEKYLLFASAVMPLLLFRKRSYIISFFLVNMVLFFSIYTYQRYYPPLLNLQPRTITFFYYVNSATAFILIFFVISYFKSLNDEYEVRMKEKNQIIEAKNNDITDSIRYAKRIQDAILTSEEILGRAFSDYFVLFKPRDIVSGDFYWAHQTEDKVIWTAADCTGHGVPGAFMSMIGNSLLNEIVIEKGILNADKILNDLRLSVITTLGQSGNEEETKDGMDMALCVWHKDTNRLEFAGANNPLYLFRKDIAGSDLAQDKGVRFFGDGIAEIKGDKQPIGFEERKNLPFTGHHIRLQEGDILYTFSDGYADQIGGEMEKKFKANQFRELLGTIQNKSMREQKEILDHTIENWKGDQEQVDDMCVIGVRI